MLQLPLSVIKRIVIQVVKPGCKTILVCWLMLMSKDIGDCPSVNWIEIRRAQRHSLPFIVQKVLSFLILSGNLLCLGVLFYVVTDLCGLFAGIVV